MIRIVSVRFSVADSGVASSSWWRSVKASETWTFASLRAAAKSAVAFSPNWATANPSSCSLVFSESSRCTSRLPARVSRSFWLSSPTGTSPPLRRRTMPRHDERADAREGDAADREGDDRRAGVELVGQGVGRFLHRAIPVIVGEERFDAGRHRVELRVGQRLGVGIPAVGAVVDGDREEHVVGSEVVQFCGLGRPGVGVRRVLEGADDHDEERDAGAIERGLDGGFGTGDVVEGAGGVENT